MRSWRALKSSLKVAVFLNGVLPGRADDGSTGDTTQSRMLPTEPEFYRCPPCDTIFTNVQTSADGRRVQDIDVQERGEPKSGTGFMFQWSRGMLDATCEYLRNTYGQNTCHSEQSDGNPPMNHTLTFEPHLARGDSTCVCRSVDRVRINFSQNHKHELPVSNACRWQHSGGFPTAGSGCTTVGGRPVESYADLVGCVAEAECQITDDRFQFAPMRDPRAVAVSTYFHYIRFHYRLPREGQTLNENAMAFLPEICQWMAIRHIVLEGLIGDKTTLFWYEESKNNPLQWHSQMLASVGVRLPSSQVSSMAEAARSRGKLNEHPGGGQAVTTRTWRDEMDPTYWEKMDDIARTWLPHEMLSRLGISNI